MSAPAKLLLFGEHTVLHGSRAYAVPLRRFTARLTTDGTQASLFAAWHAYAVSRPALAAALDLDAWSAAVPTLGIDSDIPRGYGLGSSGSLTALVWERFASAPLDADHARLRGLLGELEGFFHGTSSGLDPLVCHLRCPVVVGSGGSAVALPQNEPTLPQPTSGGRWFLYDSGHRRDGGAAIARFSESCQREAWRRDVLDPMWAQVDALVDYAALRSRPSEAVAAMRTLSRLQLNHLGFLIPGHVQPDWSRWLAEDHAYLKLCGAGGGGYFLGYAPAPLPLSAPITWL